MKKYFLNDGAGEQGPFDLDELQSKNISAETPVRIEGSTEWTTAGQLDELKDFFIAASPSIVTADEVIVETPFEETVLETAVATEPVVTTTATTVTAAAVATPVAATATKVVAAKKSTAWLSWVLTLLVLGGAGYFVYQDMEKNKEPGTAMENSGATSDSTSTYVSTTPEPAADTATSPVVTTTDPADTAVTTSTTEPVTTTTTTTTTTASTNSANAARQTAAQKAAIAKKAEDEKKKQLAIVAQKKAEADKLKQQAAQAARELEMRNNWPKYISIRNLNYETKGDGVDAFDVPIYNGTDAMLDKVTVRVEYTKKNDKKIVKTENITVYNIPPRSTVNGKAPESKKGDKANVILTGMTSRKLHFCYPQNNGNPADPYFCN